MSDSEFVYGYHVIEALLHADVSRILKIYYLAGREDQRARKITADARRHGVVLEALSRQQLTQLIGKRSGHQGIVAMITAAKSFDERLIRAMLAQPRQTARTFLLLDQVQDPHNLGACMRSANAFGVTAVIAPKDQSAALSPVVRKIACGAAEATPFIQVTNLARTMAELAESGVWMLGLCAEAEKSIANHGLTGDLALVVGNEGSGIRQRTRKSCDYLFSIPMSGTVSSLNVSASVAIGLYALSLRES